MSQCPYLLKVKLPHNTRLMDVRVTVKGAFGVDTLIPIEAAFPSDAEPGPAETTMRNPGPREVHEPEYVRPIAEASVLTRMDNMERGHRAWERIVEEMGKRVEALERAEQVSKGTIDVIKESEQLNRIMFGDPGKSLDALERLTVYTAPDGFEGTKIGEYTTRGGEKGWVLQQCDTKVVHVYRAKHFEGKD